MARLRQTYWLRKYEMEARRQSFCLFLPFGLWSKKDLLVIDSLLETITKRIGGSDVSELLEIEKSG